MCNNNAAARLRGESNYNRKQVLYLCGITEDQYYAFMHGTLFDWLATYQPLYDGEEWMNSEALLNWWRFQWYRMDDAILVDLYHAPANQRWYFYRHLHQDVFNNQQLCAIQLLDDFRNLRSRFEAELKRMHEGTIQTKA